MSGVVLGIDPGSVATGYGAITSEGNRLVYVECGVIKTRSRDPFPQRLAEIFDGIRHVVDRLQPQAAAIEAVFHARHASSALKLGHARGVAMLAVVLAGIPLHEYPPAQIKNAVAGTGRADKKQVRMMVETLLGQRFEQPDDATDALATAICHLHASPLRDRLAGGDR